MKKTVIALSIVCVCGFTSCSNDEEVDNSYKEVKIITSVSGTTKAAIDPVTGGGNLENGDKILLLADKLPHTISFSDYTIGSSKLHWDNLISGDYSGTQWSEDFLLALGEPPYDFIAYYPNVTFWQIAIDGFNAATATNPDLLGAKIAGVAKGGTVYLTFNHLMHKLVVSLSSNDYTESELSSATVGLKNLFSTASVNYTDATINYASASGTDAYPHKQGASTSFIVAPQNLPVVGTDLIEITLNGKTFTYKIPTGLTILESGKMLTFNLNLKKGSGVVEDTGSDYSQGGGISWN